MSEIKPKLTAGELFAGYGGLALIEDNVKQIKLKGWESSLAITSLLMDALEDAVPGSRVIPMNVTINELSTRVINGSKFDFWIIQGD